MAGKRDDRGHFRDPTEHNLSAHDDQVAAEPLGERDALLGDPLRDEHLRRHRQATLRELFRQPFEILRNCLPPARRPRPA
jgi:hypothetical protein